MRIGIAILFAPAVDALEIFFYEEMNSCLGRCLDADLIAFSPLGNHIRRNRHSDNPAVENDTKRVGVV